MSCKAAILVLFNFSSARKGEEAAAARDLWCQLVDILVNVAPTSESLQQQANRDSSAYPCPTVSGPPAHLLEPTTPVNSTVPGPPAHLLESTTPANSTVPGPPAHLLELTTPVNSTVPGPPAHLLELTTPVNSTVPGPPARLLEPITTPLKSQLIATEDLLSRQQAVRNKQDGGRKFTSREVARRLNLQKDELTKLAKNVHHGSKNDFIASLAESVTSKKDHGNNNWDGTLSPQDVVNLAKKAHDPKTRKPVKKMLLLTIICQLLKYWIFKTVDHSFAHYSAARSSSASARLPAPKKPRTFQVKETWTHTFFCHGSTQATSVPSCAQKIALQSVGLDAGKCKGTALDVKNQIGGGFESLRSG